jgi:allophanate hydrolase subunit 2
LAVLPGPRRDWFSDDAWRTLLTTEWQVSSDTNRVAVRLDGERLERSTTEELPSEAMVRGAIQVPSSGLPLIFGPDHPVTGGYPVIAVLTDRDADHAGQLRPGGTVRFVQARERLPGSPGHR